MADYKSRLDERKMERPRGYDPCDSFRLARIADEALLRAPYLSAIVGIGMWYADIRGGIGYMHQVDQDSFCVKHDLAFGLLLTP